MVGPARNRAACFGKGPEDMSSPLPCRAILASRRPAPTGAAFLPLVEARRSTRLARQGQAHRGDGFNANWSPDGGNWPIAGSRGASGIASMICHQGDELLILAGRTRSGRPMDAYRVRSGRQFLHVPELLAPSTNRDRSRDLGHESRWDRAAASGPRIWPRGKELHLVYFTEGLCLRSIAIDGRQAEPTAIAACSPGFHSSRGQRYLAHYYQNRLMVKDLDSNDEIGRMQVPFPFGVGRLSPE